MPDHVVGLSHQLVMGISADPHKCSVAMRDDPAGVRGGHQHFPDRVIKLLLADRQIHSQRDALSNSTSEKSLRVGSMPLGVKRAPHLESAPSLMQVNIVANKAQIALA